MDGEFISIADANCAAFTSVVLKQDPVYTPTESGRILFGFEKHPEVYRVMSAYLQGATIPAIEFAEKLKTIKHRMYLAKTKISAGNEVPGGPR
jgi:hypothetical protein